MAHVILLPALSPTMETGRLAKWLVKEGDVVSPGDVIAEIETDKATMELETDEGGVVARILVPEGTDGVAVNTPIAVIAEEGENVDVDALVAQAGQGASAAGGAAGGTDAAASAPVVENVKEAAAPAAPAVMTAEIVAEYGDGGPDPERNLSITPPPEGDPEIPEGTEFVEMTVREALRDAMAEEMRRDDRVFLMGEEVGQ